MILSIIETPGTTLIEKWLGPNFIPPETLPSVYRNNTFKFLDPKRKRVGMLSNDLKKAGVASEDVRELAYTIVAYFDCATNEEEFLKLRTI